MDTPPPRRIAFIGGGNMASALIGGLLRAGRDPAVITVVEPSEAQRDKLAQAFCIQAQPDADARLADAATVVWAVKPQLFAEAAAPCVPFVGAALQVSVMAGVRCAAVARASGSARVVRAMPNMPALIGQGIAGLFATAEVEDAARTEVDALFAPTGASLWLPCEADLDAVTALSGSGPAYVYYFLEAMMQAAVEMGLTEAQGRLLAQHTFAGATALAQQSPLPPHELRAQVTSRGGTTFAAISSLDDSGVKAAFVKALHAARQRAAELGRA
ncbi:MAG: pyrroline-5-carboxylate reductase [Betaproteobacteria bacterium]|nr:pyrroline-5-carboxylate reductase [Betaproteobacteria bacterium]